MSNEMHGKDKEEVKFENKHFNKKISILSGIIVFAVVVSFFGAYIISDRLINPKYSQEKEDDENSVLSLPLVLDAPFSKLGTQNIGLISKQLPEFAEQVIIFMLDKDWEASGLEQNTLPEYCYRVEREYSDVSSTIANNGGAL